MSDVTNADARLALHTIERRRRDVIAEIDLPRWYWLGLAACWVGLGLMADFAPGWPSFVATFVFGAVHSAVAPRALSGRHRSQRLSVRAEVVGRHVPALMFACLVGLALATIGIALGVHADGARHPATIASVVVAIAILCGGPSIAAILRRRAESRLFD